MLFSSMVFLYIFLPVVFIGNFITGRYSSKRNRLKNKNMFLLAASFFFYAWGGAAYLLLLLFSIAVNYAGGVWVSRPGAGQAVRKRHLIVIIASDLTLLFVFKYFNMAVITAENVIARGITGLWDAALYMEGTGSLKIARIALPIGISFFTFQAMSYVIDVYRGNAKPLRRPADFALYVSLFPQLVAGPVVKYTDIEPQLSGRRESTALVFEGQKRFMFGLAKKVLVADTFGAAADAIWKLETAKLGGPLAWFGMIAYTLQIYYDFSGYSDMAIGLGKMFGFSFRENFNYPYTAGSIRDFWRRWHISLSTWFRDYVYIPLGGNRRGLRRTCVNTLIVFLLTGFWHGANFTFILWGLIYAVLLIAERLFLGRLLEKNPVRFLNHVYTLFMVSLAWVFFRSDNISQGLTFAGQLFRGRSSAYSVFSYLSMEVIVMFVMAVFFAGPSRLVGERLKKTVPAASLEKAGFAAGIILLMLSILKLASGTYSAFIYFQF